MYPHKISLPEEIRPSFDINVLPGNLPENAIDAARQTEKKYLSVHIALNKGVMKIKIDNSFSPSDIRQEKRGNRRETKILDQVNMNAFLHYECSSSFPGGFAGNLGVSERKQPLSEERILSRLMAHKYSPG